MESASLALVLTPHGRLLLAHEDGAPTLDAALTKRLHEAFERGSGHGLLQLGASEVQTALPPVYSFWREFGARYVTALCTQPDAGKVPKLSDDEFNWIALAAPPMTGAEYLTAEVLGALWHELDAAFAVELSESKCGVQEFLKRRNPAWNLVGRVHFNLAENRKDRGRAVCFSRNLYHAIVGSRQRRSICRSGRRCASMRARPTRIACCRCWFPCSARRRHARG